MRPGPLILLLALLVGCGDGSVVEHRVVNLATIDREAMSAAEPESQDATPDGEVGDLASEGVDGEEIPEVEVEPLLGWRDDLLEVRGKGALAREAVGRVVAEGMEGLERCYDREQRRAPGISGTIAVRVSVGRAGRVQGFKIISSTFPGRTMERCLAKRVRRWRFDRPQGGVVVFTYAFEFNAE